MTPAASEQTRSNLWAALALAMALLACAALAPLLQADKGPLPFSRADWIAASSSDETTRHRMAEALIRDERLVGLSRLDVATMLGTPSHPAHAEGDMAWVLGPCRHSKDGLTEVLVVELDDAGLVAAASVVDA